MLIFGAELFADELKYKKPDWAQSNYRADSGLDFIGLSQLWVSGLVQAESKSITEACTNGLGKVSEFFSVEIASKSSSSQVVVNDEFQGQFSVKTDKISSINLTGISVSASYSETLQDGNYIQSYCLYRLTRSQVDGIKLKLAEEQAEIQALISKIGFDLTSQNISQAKIHLALLKGKKNVSTEVIEELANLLDEFSKNNLTVDFAFGQHAFANNDIVSMQLKSSHNVFLYLFVDDGKFTSMVLPSPAYGFNLIKKETAIKFPTRQQRQKGNVYKLPKLSRLSKEPEIFLIASKQRLVTKFTKPAFNRFIVSDSVGFQDFMAKCRLNKDCIVNRYPLLLDESQIDFSIKGYELSINKEMSPELAQVLKSSLIYQGFAFSDDGINLKISVVHKKIFSNKLEADMFVAELRVVSMTSKTKRPLLKMRFNSLYDSNKVQFYLESMLEAASKKLMVKVEAGEIAY